jgi:hypothetical protein
MAGATFHIAKTGGCALYFAPSLQYNALRIVEIPSIAGELPSAEY